MTQLPANAAITAAWSDAIGSPVAAVVDPAGAVHQTTRFKGDWLAGRDPITSAGFAPAGAHLAFAAGGAGPFGVDGANTIRIVDGSGLGIPLTRPNYNPIYGSHAAYCSDVLRHYSSITSESSYTDCTDFLGLTKYCADRGAHVMVDHRGNKAIPNCQLDHHPDSWLWQYEEEARWIANATPDAFVVVVPMLELAGETTACADLVIFACVSLAVDVAGHVDELAGGADVAD